jgi:hypothetical protein
VERFPFGEFTERNPVVAVDRPDGVDGSAFDEFDRSIRADYLSTDNCVDFTGDESGGDDEILGNLATILEVAQLT